jgi:hypothetical protein
MELLYKVVPVEEPDHGKEITTAEMWAEYWKADADMFRNMMRYRTTGHRKFKRKAVEAQVWRNRWELYLDNSV